MDVSLVGSAKCGKELKVKRETQDRIEYLRCHLTVTEIFVDRRAIDVLCGQARGWAASALFDDLGAPRLRLVLKLKDLQLDAEGELFRAGGPETGNRLILKGTRATKIELELLPGGALMTVRFTWNTAGDEAEDVSGLLARDVEVKVTLKGETQLDLAKPDSPAVKKRGRKPKSSAGRVPMTIVDRETGEIISGGQA